MYVCGVHVNTHHHKIPQRTVPRQTAPRRQHNAANTKTPIRSEPKLLCRERLLGPTPFLHTTIQPAVYIWICLFFLPIRRSLLLLGWTRASPLPFISGRAIRDTKSWPELLPTGQLLCPQYFLMLFPQGFGNPYSHASKHTVQSLLLKLTECDVK